jgi:hypothetical protein
MEFGTDGVINKLTLTIDAISETGGILCSVQNAGGECMQRSTMILYVLLMLGNAPVAES